MNKREEKAIVVKQISLASLFDGDVSGLNFVTFERVTQEQLKFGPKHHSETARSAQNYTYSVLQYCRRQTYESG